MAAEAQIGVDELEARLALLRTKLYETRRLRKQPLLDTKIITSWNALMIRALVYGGKVLQESRYVDAAARAAGFLLERHQTPEGGLWRTSRDGMAKHEGFLDDYAFLVQALLALSDASGQVSWREKAQVLGAAMVERFADKESEEGASAGFYFTSENATDLIVRQKVGTDSPLPSGNAVAAMALLELGEVEAARSTLATFAGALRAHAEGMSSMVEAAMLYLDANEPFVVSPAAQSGEQGGQGGQERPASPEEVARGGVVAWRVGGAGGIAGVCKSIGRISHLCPGPRR